MSKGYVLIGCYYYLFMRGAASFDVGFRVSDAGVGP